MRAPLYWDVGVQVVHFRSCARNFVVICPRSSERLLQRADLASVLRRALHALASMIPGSTWLTSPRKLRMMSESAPTWGRKYVRDETGCPARLNAFLQILYAHPGL
jgi:hypothetical protein